MNQIKTAIYKETCFNNIPFSSITTDRKANIAMRESEILEQMSYSCFTNYSELSLKRGQRMRYLGV